MQERILYAARLDHLIMRLFNTKAEALTYCEAYNAGGAIVAKMEPVTYVDAAEDERVISDSVRKLLTDCHMKV